MSFSADVKNELAAVIPEKPCCRKAQAYALLECGHAFSGEDISLQAEQPSVAALYERLITAVCGVKPPEAGTVRRRTVLQSRRFCDPTDRKKILETFGHSQQDVSIRLNRANLDCDECGRAFLRGAFLACGAVTDPKNDYHLEFSVPYYNLTRDLSALMGEMGINVKSTGRNGGHVLYMKESERIEDCLTFLGAPRAALEMMNVKMVKSIRNDTNRRFNCTNANIDKTVAAAAEQVRAVESIRQKAGLHVLPDGLRELAVLRVENPDMSLRELGESLTPPLSRSGVNHRIQKLMAIAAELEADT